MSYSRWSNLSNWYAFWHCDSGETKDSQVLALWHSKLTDAPLLTYIALENATEVTVKQMYPDISRKDIDEALAIIKGFLEDVDDTFKENKNE